MNIKKLHTLLLFLLLTVSILSVAAHASPPMDEYYPEEDYTYEPTYSPEGARAAVIIISALVGIAVPLVPLVFFVIKLIKKRKEMEHIDYTVIVSSSVWLVAGLVVFFIVL